VNAAADTPETKSSGFRLQILDEPLQPLDPKVQPPADSHKKADAISWFMTGRLMERRNEFKSAYEAYQKAVELDPSAIEVYRALVPLAFSLNQTEQALKYALKSVELDPSDHELLRRLGVYMAAQRNLPRAIQFLEKALSSPALNKKSGAYVILIRDLAVLYTSVGQVEKAADNYAIVFEALNNPEKYKLTLKTRKALLADPGTIYERMGQTFLAAKRTQLAIDAFEKAAKSRNGKPGNLNFNLAQVYLLKQQPDKAIEHLQKYLDAQLQSKGQAAYQLLAKILKEQDQSDQLIPRLEELAKKDSRNNHLQFFLADQYLGKDRLADAEAIFKKALEGAENVTAYVGLAEIYRKTNKPQKLLEVMGKGLKLRNGAEQLQSEIEALSEDEKLLDGLIDVATKQLESEKPELEFGSSLILAELSAQANKTDAAVRFYRYGIKLRKDRSKLLYDKLGSHLLSVDRYAQAAEVYREAADQPSLARFKPDYLFSLSQALEMDGKTKEALATIAEAKKTVPDHPLLYFQEAWIHYHSKNWEKAIELFEGVIKKFPKEQRIVRSSQLSLSNIHVQRGDMKKGEAVLEQVFASNPDDIQVNNDLGYLYADQGKKLEQAEKMIRKALKAEPENAAYLDSMGWVLYRLEKFAEAAKYLEQATQLESGSDTTIWDHLGDCYQSMKQSEKAKTAWKKALELGEESSSPDKKLLEKIKQKLKQ